MMSNNIVILLAILVASGLSAPTVDDLIISLPDGQVQGAIYTTPYNNVTYYGWRGIPFAAPPVGNLRFEAPQLPQPWTGVLNGIQDRSGCLSSINSEDESEDCLYINIYTPSLKPDEKLPVMFWIYGGGFQAGSGRKIEWGPDYFIEENVILVTHNYRTGPMGFLSTGDTAIRGNAGLKDQVLAMKWTKNNIALFGGDPEKITIFGESVGGQSVGLHLVSKKSAGLFRAGIVQSGSVMTNSSATLNPKEYTIELAGLIPGGGNYENDTQKLADFLRNCTAEVIYTAYLSITGQDHTPWPVIEVEGEDAFLTESPYVLYDSGNFNRVPAMMGICAEEGLSEKAAIISLATLLDADNKKLIPSDLRPDPSNEDVVASKIKSLYLQDGMTFSKNLTGTVKSDNRFSRALIKNAELHSKYVPVYLYQFAYSTVPADIDGVERAYHGAEINFLFYSDGNFGPPHLRDDTNATNLLVQNRTVKLWANFAKFLNPTPEKTELLENVIWPTVTPNNIQYLNINATLEVREDLKGEVYRGWNETYYSYGEKPFVTF